MYFYYFIMLSCFMKIALGLCGMKMHSAIY